MLSASAKQIAGLVSLLRHLSPQGAAYLVPLKPQFFNWFKKIKICSFYSLYHKVGATTLFLFLYISELKTLSSVLIIICATFLSLFPTTIFFQNSLCMSINWEACWWYIFLYLTSRKCDSVVWCGQKEACPTDPQVSLCYKGLRKAVSSQKVNSPHGSISSLYFSLCLCPCFVYVSLSINLQNIHWIWTC